MKILSETLQQYLKFTEDSDPIEDMGIGIKKKIINWLIQTSALNVDEFVILSNFQIDTKNVVNISNLCLREIPNFIKFRYVIGGFYCDNNEFTSLNGTPTIMSGSFIASWNKLENLKNGPIEVKGSYFVSHNELTSLEGIAKKIKETLSISNNKLTNLRGVPSIISGDFYMHNNPIETLKYFPKEIAGDVYYTYSKVVNEKTIRKHCKIHGDVININK